MVIQINIPIPDSIVTDELTLNQSYNEEPENIGNIESSATFLVILYTKAYCECCAK